MSTMRVAIDGSIPEAHAMKKLLQHWLCQLLHCHHQPNRVRFGWKVEEPILKARTMLEISITNEQKRRIRITPMTDAARPAKLDGKPEWSVVSGPATLDVAEDGLSAFVISNDDDLSDTIVKITADADLGSAVEEVADTVLVHTTHANAKNLGLSAEDAVLKTPVAPPA